MHEHVRRRGSIATTFEPVPRFRPDISALSPYVPGRPIEAVAAELGIPSAEIVKLASNECPDGPFPAALQAAARHLAGANRYPDDAARDLTSALSIRLGVPTDHVWLGAGSVSLLSHIALAVGGPGTKAVYASPSFVMYRIATRWAMSDAVEVPLTQGEVHDLDAMRAAIDEDTNVVYLCNPNNPSGTIVDSTALDSFIDSVPDQTLVVVDEAYHDYVTSPRYSTAIPQAQARPNVIVLRTFSKIYALAGHRIGYGVARPETIAELRKAQPPFTVTDIAQAAAVASLGDPVEHARRVESNAAARHHLLGVLSERGLAHTDSEANFVYLETPHPVEGAAALFTDRGVIVRPMSGRWIRVTVGSEEENRRFVASLDEIIDLSNRR